MRRFIAGAGRLVPTLVRDCAMLSGAAMIAYGAWLIAPAAGFIVGGVALVAISVLPSVRRSKQ